MNDNIKKLVSESLKKGWIPLRCDFFYLTGFRKGNLIIRPGVYNGWVRRSIHKGVFADYCFSDCLADLL
jgi:hypothetical protein